MTTFPRFHAILSRARVFTVALFTATGLGLVAQAAVGPTYTFSTLAGRAGESGFTDGAGTAAEFTTPLGVAVDAFGVVYVADTLGHTIRRISPDGEVTTLAGKGGVFGYADGRWLRRSLISPRASWSMGRAAFTLPILAMQ